MSLLLLPYLEHVATRRPGSLIDGNIERCQHWTSAAAVTSIKGRPKSSMAAMTVQLISQLRLDGLALHILALHPNPSGGCSSYKPNH